MFAGGSLEDILAGGYQGAGSDCEEVITCNLDAERIRAFALVHAGWGGGAGAAGAGVSWGAGG